MREKPIIFSTPMVQAILEDIKTKTRRIIRLPDGMDGRPVGEIGNEQNPLGLIYPCGIKRPAYQLGDVLWVREKWCNINKPEFKPEYYYYADTKYAEDYDPTEWKWRPSIHMPRAAARIFLKVTDVKVEQLQDITDADAHAEGMDSPSYPIIQFKDLWNDLNDKRGYGWETNPWVWVYTFERIRQYLREAAQYTDQSAMQYATP